MCLCVSVCVGEARGGGGGKPSEVTRSEEVMVNVIIAASVCVWWQHLPVLYKQDMIIRMFAKVVPVCLFTSFLTHATE